MKYIASILLALATFTVHAETQKWTLEECVAYAVENNPEGGIQQARNKIYSSNYTAAIASLLPSINGGTSASFNYGRVLGDDNTYVNRNTFSNDYDLSSSVTIFSGFRKINEVRIQNMNRLMGKQDLQYKRDMIAYTTIEAFFNVQYYQELVVYAREQLEESVQNLKKTERMAELGIKGFPDVAEMRAREASDNYNLTRQQNRLQIGIILLKQQMNLPIDQDLEITEYDSQELITKTELTAYEIYERNSQYLPQTLSAEYAVKAQRYSYSAAKGRLSPTLSMNGGYGTKFYKPRDGSEYDAFRDQFQNKRSHYVGFSLSVPIFNGLSVVSGIKNSKYLLVIASKQRDQTLRTLYSDIEQAVADMNGQADAYVQASRQTEAMSVAHRVNQRKYEEGLTSALDLYTSSSRLLQAKAEEVNSRLTYHLKSRLVNYYNGSPFFHENMNDNN